MKLILSVVVALSATSVACSGIPLITFDGSKGTTFNFQELNDPVMGGQSTGQWAVNASGGYVYGSMRGTVVDVPSLGAPGFIKAAAEGSFPDISSALGGSLVLNVRSSTADYRGFRVSFAVGASTNYACAGGGSIPYSRGCFKAKFHLPQRNPDEDGPSFVPVRIPFANFSDLWSPATGEHTAECQDDSSACPQRSTLASITRVEFWAEGVNGDVRLEVQSAWAEPRGGASSSSSNSSSSSSSLPGQGRAGHAKSREDEDKARSPPVQYNICRGAIQDSLRYGVSGRTTPAGLPVAVEPSESLASAVCCDHRMLAFAEPRFLYEAPDIALFSRLQKDGRTTSFYDSVCGAELFRAPVNRSLADFQADTQEHGWPSFRAEEVVRANVFTDRVTGYVTSVCGTHLGSFLPDAAGDRWCIDLACVAGNP